MKIVIILVCMVLTGCVGIGRVSPKYIFINNESSQKLDVALEYVQAQKSKYYFTLASGNSDAWRYGQGNDKDQLEDIVKTIVVTSNKTGCVIKLSNGQLKSISEYLGKWVITLDDEVISC